jgi:hypothetical protein
VVKVREQVAASGSQVALSGLDARGLNLGWLGRGPWWSGWPWKSRSGSCDPSHSGWLYAHPIGLSLDDAVSY